MNNYMYIIECGDGSLYTGWTNDLAKRIKAHNTGQGAKYTKSRRPVRLCYWERFETKQEAMSREAKVKRLTRAQKIRLIQNEYGLSAEIEMTKNGNGLSGSFTEGTAKNATEGFDKNRINKAMRIRPVSEADDRMAVSRVYEESWKEAYQNIVPQGYLDSIPEGSWCEAAFRPGMHSLVMMIGDEIVGTASYCKRRLFDSRPDEANFPDQNDTESGEVISIYFLPQYMGRGYGTLLMQAVLAELKNIGYQSCCLWVLEENERARHFYEKMGFVSDGISMEQEIGGKRLREMRYVLGLG